MLQKLGGINSQMLKGMDPDLAKAARAAQIQAAFARALTAVCDSTESARFMLDHIQAVYIMRDDKPQKKTGKKRIILRVYSDDSTVRAEIDARQEWLRMSLARQGIHYDTLKINASTFNMKQRKPFADVSLDAGDEPIALAHEDVERHELDEHQQSEIVARVNDADIAKALGRALKATSATAVQPAKSAGKRATAITDDRQIELLEMLKRAFCLTFGENAPDVLEKVNAAYLSPVASHDEERRMQRQAYWCALYSTDPRLETVMNAFGPQIRKDAWRIGLRIRGIRVLDAPKALADVHAFPRSGAPAIVEMQP